MYRILMRGFTQISIDDPYLRPNSFAIASEEDAVDLSMEILNGEFRKAPIVFPFFLHPLIIASLLCSSRSALQN